MITFILKEPTVLKNGARSQNKNNTLILMQVFFSGRRLRMSTGEFIAPEHWNPKTKRPRKSAPNSAVLEKYLDGFQAKTKEILLGMKSEFQVITPDTLREAIVRDMQTGGRKVTLMDFISRFIQESAATRKPGSLSVYTSVQKLLLSYPGNKDFNDIGVKWFEKFQLYMERGGYSANYIGKNVAIIRELMTLARAQKLHRNEQYLDKTYKKPHEDAQTIFLTEYELLKMYGIELPEGLNRVRNRSMISAFTCLRFSDSSKINLDDIRNGLIYDRNVKTGKNVVLPIHWVVKQIMEDHPDGLPREYRIRKPTRRSRK